MYEDFKGQIIIDSKDSIITIEEYAKLHSVDVEKYNVESIQIYYSLDGFTHYFLCSVRDQEETKIQIKFKPKNSFFSEFCKRATLIIENYKN